MAIKFSTEKKQKINKKLQKLTSSILQEKSKEQPNKTNIENWQNQINDIENYKTQGTIIRSKEITIINEKTPNKYFYLQEQQKQIKKHIKQLQNEKNEIIKTNSEILKECRIFYQKLFTKQENCVETQNEILNKLPTSMKNEQNEYLTKQINKNELKQAMFQMQNEKSPGIDGIPVEFYKTFYETLENDLIQL